MKEHVDKERIQYLSSRISPYLIRGDEVFDLICGYSPLCETVLNHGCSITGVDESPDAVNWLKTCYPSGCWCRQVFGVDLTDDLGGATILFLLGVAEPQHAPAFQQYLRKLLDGSRIRVILTDTLIPTEKEMQEGRALWFQGYMRNIGVIKSLGYTKSEAGEYVVTRPLRHKRTYSIYERLHP
jgi:hypothetical protein